MRKYRTFSPVSVGNILQKVTPKLIPKKNYMIGSLMHDWTTIVGDALSTVTAPQKITFSKGESKDGILHLLVRDNSTSMMVHHQQNVLLDKANAYLGHKALTKLTLRIGSFPSSSTTKKNVYRSLTAEEQEDLAHTLHDFPEGPLKESLKHLGTTLREVGDCTN